MKLEAAKMIRGPKILILEKSQPFCLLRPLDFLQSPYTSPKKPLAFVERHLVHLGKSFMFFEGLLMHIEGLLMHIEGLLGIFKGVLAIFEGLLIMFQSLLIDR